jgi:protein SCO1/2
MAPPGSKARSSREPQLRLSEAGVSSLAVARPRLIAFLFLSCVIVLAGCVSGGHPPATSTVESKSTGFRGDVLAHPEVLTPTTQSASFATGSGKTTIGELQRQHRLLLLYFGYTNCPDECPTTMADLGVALRQLPTSTRAVTQVAFVSSDPQRDTPSVLKVWLAHFDAELPVPFVGLTGSVAEADAIGASLGVPLTPPVREADGSISVQHGTQVLAFVDNKASLVWLADTSAEDFAHDITLLVKPVAS